MKTDSGSRADIIVKMKDLKLSGMVESYDEIIANTARIKGSATPQPPSAAACGTSLPFFFDKFEIAIATGYWLL